MRRQLCDTARNHFGWHSIALAQALQYELPLSQKDVIGEWVPVGEPGDSNVVWENKKWLRGLQWSNIDENLTLRHAVGSSGRKITVDLRTAPMVLRELDICIETYDSAMREELPLGGPVVLCDINTVPWSTAEFRRKWRLIARKAGVPDNVNNRDSLRIDDNLRMARRA